MNTINVHKGVRLFLSLFLIILLLQAHSVANAMPITHRITVQPIQVRDSAAVNAANVSREIFESVTDKIWMQAGIDVSFRDWRTFDNDSFLNGVSGTDGFRNTPSSFTMASDDPTVLNMWFVQSFDNPLQFGVGYIPENPSAFSGGFAVIADNVFAGNRFDTIAHEIGHTLGLQHTMDSDPMNLLTNGQARTIPSGLSDIAPTGSLDFLTEQQINSVFASQLVTPVPIPAAWVLFATGSLLMRGVATYRRSRGVLKIA